MKLLENLFQLKQHGTTVRTELLAGLTTFLTMSYIVFVNPDILSTTGMDPGAVFVATCLAAALGSLVMAFAAYFPVGMAPGRFAQRLEVVCEAAGLDRRRLLCWILAWTGLSAAWFIGDSDPLAAIDLRIAALAAAELDR